MGRVRETRRGAFPFQWIVVYIGAEVAPTPPGQHVDGFVPLGNISFRRIRFDASALNADTVFEGN